MSLRTDFRFCLLAASLAGTSGLTVLADELSATSSDTNVPPAVTRASEFLPWHVELKRQWTNRGTPQENSKTTLRLEATPREYLSLVRVDIPFIDEKNGDPLTPHLGDIVLKLESAPWGLGVTDWQVLLETTFPSAQPESLGTGKYELTPGTEIWVPIWSSSNSNGPPVWQTGVKPLVEQFVSVAGDPSRGDINYTQIEFPLLGSWNRKVSLNPKFMINYVGGVTSGAVFEFEPHWNISRRWELDVTLGHLLWGQGTPGTYQKKVEFSVRFNF
jgi:hypothetical protein